MNLRNAWYWVIVALLLVAALVVGYLLMRRSPPAMPSGQGTEQGGAPSPSISAEDRTAVLQTPRNTSTKEERDAHFKIVQRLAVMSETLDVSGCNPNPLVLKHRQIQDIQVTNKDDVPHELQVNPQHLYTVPAHGSISIPPDFGSGTGVYGYGCDNSLNAVGLFFIVP
jgi:hypothetical protein